MILLHSVNIMPVRKYKRNGFSSGLRKSNCAQLNSGLFTFQRQFMTVVNLSVPVQRCDRDKKQPIPSSCLLPFSEIAF
jgi:hypothetical protein